MLVNVDNDNQREYIGELYQIVGLFESDNIQKVYMRNIKTERTRTEKLKNVKIFDNEVDDRQEALRLFK